MWNVKLCLGTSDEFDCSVEEQIRLFHKIGFDAFFTDWFPQADLAGWRALADQLGMEYQSVHAPFGRAADLWKTGEEAQAAVDELIACLRDCAKYSIPIMVMHAFIGFEDHTPTQAGIENFQKVAEEANKLGVKIALENTEGEEYLAALLKCSKGDPCVGFCLDTGHEMCYNHSQDLLALYGDRLIGTHINDNLGIRDFGGEITWRDDLHLLPFDGIGDWEGLARRLARCGYEGCLTFELCKKSKPDRHENDGYDRMPLEEYLTEAYKRACRVAAFYRREIRRG